MTFRPPLSATVLVSAGLQNWRAFAASTPTATPPSARYTPAVVRVANDQAERVAIAQQLAPLPLTIRAIDDTPAPTDGIAALFSGDVSPARSPVGVHVHVIQGDKRSEVTFQ
jgi:Flp pilus assembly protein CpaB